jgi:hypothetical protein
VRGGGRGAFILARRSCQKVERQHRHRDRVPPVVQSEGGSGEEGLTRWRRGGWSRPKWWRRSVGRKSPFPGLPVGAARPRAPSEPPPAMWSASAFLRCVAPRSLHRPSARLRSVAPEASPPTELVLLRRACAGRSCVQATSARLPPVLAPSTPPSARSCRRRRHRPRRRLRPTGRRHSRRLTLRPRRPRRLQRQRQRKRAMRRLQRRLLLPRRRPPPRTQRALRRMPRARRARRMRRARRAGRRATARQRTRTPSCPSTRRRASSPSRRPRCGARSSTCSPGRTTTHLSAAEQQARLVAESVLQPAVVNELFDHLFPPPVQTHECERRGWRPRAFEAHDCVFRKPDPMAEGEERNMSLFHSTLSLTRHSHVTLRYTSLSLTLHSQLTECR